LAVGCGLPLVRPANIPSQGIGKTWIVLGQVRNELAANLCQLFKRRGKKFLIVCEQGFRTEPNRF
jgi:hypothetical protein